MNNHTYVQQDPQIAPLLEGADFLEVESIDLDLSHREFVARVLSFQPGWMTFLYRLRWGLVRLLGMQQEGIPAASPMQPEDVPMQPGEQVRFFSVKDAQEDAYWFAEGVDRHLTARLGVVVEPLPKGRRRFHLVTVVHHNSWRGPVYFSLIRPFHHLIVNRVLRSIQDGATA